MITLSEKNDASLAEMDFNRSIASAAIDCGKYISPTESDIAEAGPEWKPSLPIMEVEELEVINIELSDYPIPENVTTYDWWWA